MRINDVHGYLGGAAPVGGGVSAERLASVCDAAEIGLLGVAPAFQADVYRSYERENVVVLRLVKEQERFLGLFRIAPSDRRYAAIQAQKAAENPSIVGLKLHPGQDPFSVAEIDAIAGVLREIELPLLISSGHETGCHPTEWMDFFEGSPNLHVLLNHGGRDKFEEAARMAEMYPQVFLGTSLLTLQQLRWLYDRLGPDRLVYESSMPLSHPAIEVRKVNLAVADEDDRRKVLCSNARRLLRLKGGATAG
ncbi:MAG: amidohydrolase family protein [Planctomycetes bacterium]|nr:amidohydrolase family protein [Planctomycetota bacterium]